MLHLIQPALLSLRLAQYVPSLEAIEHLRVHVSAVPHCAPEKNELAVAVADFRADVSDEAAGIDARVDPVQGATDLVRLAVVQRPECAIRTPVARRETAVQIEDSQPALGKQCDRESGTSRIPR